MKYRNMYMAITKNAMSKGRARAKKTATKRKELTEGPINNNISTGKYFFIFNEAVEKYPSLRYLGGFGWEQLKGGKIPVYLYYDNDLQTLREKRCPERLCQGKLAGGTK